MGIKLGGVREDHREETSEPGLEGCLQVHHRKKGGRLDLKVMVMEPEI